MKRKKWLGTVFIIVVLILSALSLITMASLSFPQAQKEFGKSHSYLARQALWLLIGGMGFVFTANLNYKKYKDIIKYFYILGAFTLVMVLLIGRTSKGATRWISIGGFAFQPSEFVKIILIITLATFVLAGIWLVFKDGYIVTSMIDRNGPSSPLGKQVALEAGAWFNNYKEMPILWVFPLLAVGSALLNVAASKANRNGFAFLFSSLTMAGIIFTAGIAMFPFVMPSISHPEMSLLMWDSTSSKLTLTLMLFLAVIFVVLILAYTVWSYSKMFGRLDSEFIEENKNTLY